MNCLARPAARRSGVAGFAVAITTSVAVVACAGAANANETGMEHGGAHDMSGGGHGAHSRPDALAPVGVMGAHMHDKGNWMFSYRYMHMDMGGNRIGTRSVTPEEIATTIPNRFAGVPGQPPTLRVVPTAMTMDMHMFSGMYAPSNDLTLMAMVNYVEKEMSHITFQGGTGTTRLGTFVTEAKGFGDTKLLALYQLFDDHNHHLHLNLGVSLPTGSIRKRDDVLTPMNARPNLRLPYAMQLGTGTFDLLPGLTYTGRRDDFTWGAQYRAEVRLERANDEGYRWGDKHGITAWAAYQWAPWISTSLRIDATTQGALHGIDPNIVAPVQTANPDFYGGERVDVLLGINTIGQSGALKGHRFALEVGLPVYQDLNGPQMETDWTLAVGWQKSF